MRKPLLVCADLSLVDHVLRKLFTLLFFKTVQKLCKKKTIKRTRAIAMNPVRAPPAERWLLEYIKTTVADAVWSNLGGLFLLTVKILWTAFPKLLS